MFLCGLTFFVGLGRPAITDSDEAFYAEAAREMVDRGDWITPHYNDEYRFEKPVLYYWMAALVYQAVGVGEGAARFPSALAGLVLVLTTFACARRWYDERTGLLAGAITATSFGYVAVARQALPDLVLAAFITLATWTALEALVASRPRGRDRARRWWLVASGAALGAAFLVKGPVGVALPAAIVGPLALRRLWSGGSAGAADTRLPRLAGDVALLTTVCVVVAAPWFVAMTSVHGVAYLDRFFVAENLERFATDRYNVARPIWYYVPIVVGGLLPWSPLMLLWWRPVWRVLQRVRQVQPVEVWLLVWAAVPFVFFSISFGKQPRYILAVLPPLAVLLARAVGRRLRLDEVAPIRRDPLVAAAGIFSGVILCALGILVYRAHSLLDGVSATAVLAGVGSLLVAGGGVAFVAVSRRQHWLPRAIVTAAVVSTLAVQYVVLSRPGPEPVQDMAAMVRAAYPSSQAYGRYGVFVRNLIYYARRPHVDLSSVEQVAAFLGSNEPVLGVVTAADMGRLRASGVVLHELGRVSYLNTGNLRLSTLLWPDPQVHLQTIVLVSNQSPAQRQSSTP